MTEQQDREIATLIAIPECDRTPAQAERLDNLQAMWEAEQSAYYAYRVITVLARAGVRYVAR